MQPDFILLIEGMEKGELSLVAVLDETEHNWRHAPTMLAAMDLLKAVAPTLVFVNWLSLDEGSRAATPEFLAALLGTPVVCVGKRKRDQAAKWRGLIEIQGPVTPRKVLNQIGRYMPAKDGKERVIVVGDICLNLARRVVTVENQAVAYLTPRQAGLLEALLRRPGETVTRRELMHDVWLTDYVEDTRTLEVHIRWLRMVIELDPSRPLRLVTDRGVGYRLMPQG